MASKSPRTGSCRSVLITPLLFAFAWLLVLPAAAYAQASITGVVRDTSGAVLPGVTIEAASPVLIEKVRSVTADGGGQYRVVDLRPGTYTVTFTLPGFSTVRREGIELAGTFTATINAEMRVGSLEETITVTGESPIVDVQSTAQQQVLGKDVIDSIPSSRTHFSVATLIPAMQTSNTGDVGGTNSINLVFLTAHGGRNTDQRVMIDGLSTNNAEGAGQFSGYLPNMSSTQEMAVDYAAGPAEMPTGGVRMNLIPREGGNVVRGTGFLGGMSGGWMQGSNYDADLKARGLATPNDIKKLWDANIGLGGPIKRDKAWWYAAYRFNGEQVYTGGFGNLNANQADKWLYVPDPTKRLANLHEQRSYNGRLTWQATQKHKISAFYDAQYRCVCPNTLNATTSAEAGNDLQYPHADFMSVTWSSPYTNRLLLEAGVSYHPERWLSVSETWGPGEGPNKLLIGVTDQADGRVYRARNTQFSSTLTVVTNTRASMSYVTGSHALKVGFNNQHATRTSAQQFVPANMSYRFRNGVPNQITQTTRPQTIDENIGFDLGLFAQDKWTIGKLTANLGVRFDYLTTYFPPQHLGPTTFFPNRDISFPHIDWVNWKDVTPRLGAVYDLFGNGRTALRVSLNKYMVAFGLQGTFGDGSNPINLIPTTTTRSWNDSFYGAGDPRTGNYVPDCDLTSPLGNAECGAMADRNFGLNIPSAAVDPDIIQGFGTRGYNWEFSTGIQHQLTPVISVDVAFFRRWYGNFIAIDNLATTAADYSRFSITAPTDSRLPNGGGYTIGNLYDLNPDKVGQVNSLYTSAENYGKQIERWNGVDVGVNTRFGNRILLQGGMSVGRTVTDNCEVLAKSPEIISGRAAETATAQVALPTTPAGVPYCHVDTGFLTQVKGFGSYTVPKIDVQASASVQSYVATGTGTTTSGPRIDANYVATNAVIAPSLGRNLSGGLANATVNLLATGQLYGERVNQVDLRVAKILTFGRTRTSASLDLYNLFNLNSVTVENANYASFRVPLAAMQARFMKLGVQIDF
ncbi:MAG: carboxypeptidase regulatory-like domain-containing protein [Vicinamibacterales bacterium]